MPSLLQRTKAELKLLAAGEPGKRFLEFHERRRARERNATKWRTTAYVVAGVVLFAGGVLISLPPGVPGFFLWIPGLALLVARFRAFAIFLDRTEAFIRRLFGQRVKREGGT
jgi:UPF0716 family protein affecting phage T7 exclusion